ncbi:G protein-coupled glucose receptor regulating Gpa2-domain-containing protein [Hypoxylon argillaceum]|nr:G protein-coupled glucose receptor regulating Gpa2-domain-containing protein [Hypoxylon argillaceum]
MAPLLEWTAAAAAKFLYTSYDGLVLNRDTTQPINPTDSQTLAVMWVSFSFATISVIVALFAFYWFVRMRRGFRQDLIMLLVQSDLAKTLWLLINPLFYFITKKPFSSNWAYCQVSGFFLTATIEASDIAVLLIAIDTALFIVKRQHPGAAPGLQPYRRYAYAIWTVVPLLTAAIVPITGHSFVDNGANCYLPVHPEWYNMVLAWAPRYAIFISIIVTYTSLYVYISVRFRRLGEDQRRASNMSSQSTGCSSAAAPRRPKRTTWRGRSSGSVPPTPTLTTHNLLDSPQEAETDPAKLRQYSAASTVSTLQIGEDVYLPAAPEQAVRKSSIAWNLVDFGRDGARSSASSTPYVDTDPASPGRDSMTLALLPTEMSNTTNNTTNDTAAPAISAPEAAHVASSEDASSPRPRHMRRDRWRRRLTAIRSEDFDAGSRGSLAHIISALRQGSPEHAADDDEQQQGGRAGDEEARPLPPRMLPRYSSTFSSSSPAAAAAAVRLPTEVSEETVRRSRDRMQRQLWLLFVYPVIYMLTWVAPFAAHVYSTIGSSSPSSSPPSPSSPTHLDLTTHSSPAMFFSPEFNTTTSTITSYASAAVLATMVGGAGGAGEGISTTQPLALRIASLASLCAGAAADCAFFAAWERPWRHPRGGFWAGLARRLRVRRRGPGRSRDERVADERAARVRRDKEREMATAAAAAGRGGGSTGGSPGGGGDEGRRRREWWDALDEVGL